MALKKICISNYQLKSLKYILEMAEKTAVKQSRAYFIDPSLLGLYNEQQRHIKRVNSLLKGLEDAPE